MERGERPWGTYTVLDEHNGYKIKRIEVLPGQLGTNHRLENPGVIPLVIIEVQSGEYLGEDDIVRFQDDYHRVEPADQIV
jgi:mannose-6-phosphate isomerase